MTDRTAVSAWVERYVAAWDANDPGLIRDLFTPDAEYRWNPWDDPARGHDEITAAWLDHADAPGDHVFAWEVAAVDGSTGVVRGRTEYLHDEDAGRPYANLWLLELTDDGRARSFTEWWMQPRA